jgi:hypothetical protein
LRQYGRHEIAPWDMGSATLLTLGAGRSQRIGCAHGCFLRAQPLVSVETTEPR